MPTISEESRYFVAEGLEDGNVVVYRAPQSVPSGTLESTYPTLINIYWPFDSNDSGMPSPDINDQLALFENTTSSLDAAGISHLMLVVTGNGRKEWIWYVNDVESWLDQFNSLLSAHDVFPIELEMEVDEDWSTYHQFIESTKGI
ncbi:DUF695 domain-containing protein [Ferrimonas aestuarii]|nr:DUF695 domain-containing protein [Ferrimonas aestuarii]